MKLAATVLTTTGSESLATHTSGIPIPSLYRALYRVGESVTRFRRATTMMTTLARRSVAGDRASCSNSCARLEDCEDRCLTSTAPIRKALASSLNP